MATSNTTAITFQRVTDTAGTTVPILLDAASVTYLNPNGDIVNIQQAIGAAYGLATLDQDGNIPSGSIAGASVNVVTATYETLLALPIDTAPSGKSIVLVSDASDDPSVVEETWGIYYRTGAGATAGDFQKIIDGAQFDAKVSKVDAAVAGDIATLASDGGIVDSGVSVTTAIRNIGTATDVRVPTELAVSTGLDGKQNVIAAGSANNIVAYSGTAGTVQSLTRVTTIAEVDSATDTNIPTELAVATAISEINVLKTGGYYESADAVIADAANLAVGAIVGVLNPGE
jgi:hypothetical protein